MQHPFISITDFMSADQVRRMLSVLRSVADDSFSHKLGVGVMTSRKVLNGLPTDLSKAFPLPENIASIFIDDEKVFNVLHYADYSGIDVYDNLKKAVSVSGPHLQAIQLDMVWPDADEVIAFSSDFPNIKIIIQINPKAFEIIGDDPHNLLVQLAKYRRYIDYVLLDRSMGQGIPMSAQNLFPYICHLNGIYKLVIAGGLGPTTVELVEPIVTNFNQISIDAQGRLRPSGSYMDPIDWNMAEIYLRHAVAMFKRHS